MLCDFRRTFNPTREELIERYNTLLKLHNDEIGECATCRFYIAPSSPGFVTDYGDCKKNKKYFLEKICRIRKIGCTEYAENVDGVTKIKTKLTRL